MDISSSELTFFNGHEGRLPIYLALRETLYSLAPSCVIRVHKTTISFRAPRPFVYVSFGFKKSYPGFPHGHLMLSFNAKAASPHPHVIQSTPIRPGLYTLHALVPASGQVAEDILELIKQSLQMRNP